MDSVVLTRLAIEILIPFASVSSHGISSSVNSSFGKAFYSQGQRLYEALRTRFTEESDNGRLSKTLDDFIEDPQDYSPLMEKKIYLLLQTDPDFHEELQEIIQTGPHQQLTSEGEVEVDRLRLVNSLGIGRQEMRTEKRSTVENLDMNIA
jgi:hypothetical protein